MSGRQFATTLLVGALVLAAAGCGQREALAFNDTVARGVNKIVPALNRFVDAAGVGDKGTKANLAELEAARKALTETVADARKDFEKVAVPSSGSAKEMAETFRRLLKEQEDALKGPFAEAVRLLQEAKGAAPTARFDGLLRPVIQRTAVTATELRDLQDKFAKDHNIRVKSAP
jgi:hypothetical protein